MIEESGLEKERPQGHERRPYPFTILDKTIVKDLVKTLLSVWSVIVVIIVSREFIRVLDKAIEGRVSSETLLSLLALKTVIISVTLLPAALFMAVLMVLGRMYRDQEMAAIASAGGGAGTLYRAVFMMVLPLSVIAAGLSLYVSPWAEASITRIMHQDEASSDLRGIAAGKFSEYSQGDLVFYVERITDDKTMHQVFVQSRQQGKLAIINAKSAHLQDLPDGSYLVFEQGERIQGQPGRLDYVIETFDEYAVRMEEQDTIVNLNRPAVATATLWGSQKAADIAELQRRFAIPLSLLLLSFIGVPLAQISPRGGVYGNILMGFLIYFSYGNLVRLSQVWVINASIPAWLGGIGVNIFLAVIGAVLLARWYGWQWLIIKIREKTAL
ncbi:MAG: LPS export ABC transporter permease LptF [Methylovulum sp.]|nr:MAG: LPS export ABC transporter permease LptF [Methylovulum sp.]